VEVCNEWHTSTKGRKIVLGNEARVVLRVGELRARERRVRDE